jgi:hypothetical protein
MASSWYRATPGQPPPWLGAVAQLIVNPDRSRTMQRRHDPYSDTNGAGRGDTAHAPCPDGFTEVNSGMSVFADQLHVTCAPLRPDLYKGGCPKGTAPLDASMPGLVLSMSDWVNAPEDLVVSEVTPKYAGTQACFRDPANALPIGGRTQPPAQPAADKPTYVFKMSVPARTQYVPPAQRDAVPPPPSGSPPWTKGVKPVQPQGAGVAPWMIVAGGVALAGSAYWLWRKKR